MKENKVQQFLNDNFGEVRCFADELNNPWFCANDCLKILEYAESGWQKKVSRLNKHGVRLIKTKTLRGYQNMNYINEYNLLKLISEAKTITSDDKIKFKKWLIKQGLLSNDEYYTERKEIIFLDKLEQVLNSFNIKGIRQYNIDKYRIDYYIPSLNIAIEYDENGHANYTYEQHEGRQKEIEKELGCKFIRVTDENSDEYNILYCYCMLRDELHKYIEKNINSLDINLVVYEILKIRCKISKISELLNYKTLKQEIFELNIINEVIKKLYKQCNDLKQENYMLKQNLLQN